VARKFYDAVYQPGATQVSAQNAWYEVCDAMDDIDMPREIPATATSFYGDGSRQISKCLSDMLQECRQGYRPHRLSYIHIPQMDPEYLLHSANRLLISRRAVFKYCESVANFLYDKLEVRGIADRTFTLSAVRYLAENEIDARTIGSMNAFVLAAKLPDSIKVAAVEGTDEFTRKRLERFGSGIAKEVLTNEFDKWFKYLCFLGIGNARSVEKSKNLFPNLSLVIAAENGVFSKEWLLMINALAEFLRGS